MSGADVTCHTVVFDDSSETPSAQELRNSLASGTDEVKLDTLRKVIVATINWNSFVRLIYSTGMKLLLTDSDGMAIAHAAYAYH